MSTELSVDLILSLSKDEVVRAEASTRPTPREGRGG